MIEKFNEVIYHRLRYFLSPQLDLYKNVVREFGRSEGSVLDYGCGNGVGTMLLCDFSGRVGGVSVYGVDCDDEAVLFADSLFGHLCSFAVADWSTGREGSADERFRGPHDLVTCVEVIEHVESPEPLLERLAAATSPSGVCVVSTLNHNSQYRKNDAHVRGYRVVDFGEALRRHFAHVVLTDYQLHDRLGIDSSVTPVVGICRTR